jgi:hypothetical protein
LTVVELIKLPDVPVTVTVAPPVEAVLLAVRVKTLDVVPGFGLNEAVTPLGRPAAEKLTVLLKPFCGVTVIVLLPIAPCTMLTLPGDGESVKLGAALTVSETVVLAVRLPDVPVTVTVTAPVEAVLLAVRVKTLDVVPGFGLNEAVTPLGRPAAEKLTVLLKPFCGITVIVLVPDAPCIMLTLFEAESVYVGGGVTAKETGLLLFMLGATETTIGPEVAPKGTVIVIELALQLFMVTGTPFSVTVLLPCEDPKAVPDINTWVPTDPDVGEMLLMNGEGLAAVLTETLS